MRSADGSNSGTPFIGYPKPFIYIEPDYKKYWSFVKKSTIDPVNIRNIGI
jgi:hypothetical protein